jgi:hypothetical protein
LIKFVRIRGKIIPIVQKAVAKGSGYFGRASKMRAHDENIKALQAVRKTVEGKARQMMMVRGAELDTVHEYKNKVIKRFGKNDIVMRGHLNRRIGVEASLHHIGSAPKTFLIKTKNKLYMVQDKVKLARDMADEMLAKSNNPYSAKSNFDINDKLKKYQSATYEKARRLTGIHVTDTHFANWGINAKNKVKIIDGGNATFGSWKSPGTWPLRSGIGMDDTRGGKALRYWNKNLANIRARKFIIKAKPE